jgi:hypothetical protein
LISAVFEGQKELDRCGGKQGEADQIELRFDSLDDGEFARFDVTGDVDGGEEEGDEAADGKVDIEACDVSVLAL